MDNFNFACNEDVAHIRSERVLDFAKRLLFSGVYKLTEHRRDRAWDEVESFLQWCLQEGATGWEENENNRDYPCDLFYEHFDQYDMTDGAVARGVEYKFISLCSAVSRSAFDAVDGFPGGVIGFTVGDLKLMYDRMIPAWIDDGWSDQKGNEVSLNDLSDEKGIWI